MRCLMQNDEGAGLLLSYANNKLGATASTFVEGHLRICPDCNRTVEEQKRVWHALETWDAGEVSSDFDRRLYARVDAESARGGFARWTSGMIARWTPVPWRPALATAALCATLAGGLLIQLPASRPMAVQDSVAKTERVDVEQLDRTLQDLQMLKELNPSLQAEANPGSSI